MEGVAAQFVAAYYKSVVLGAKDVSQFYDGNAFIYRPGMPETGTGSPKPTELALPISNDSKVVIAGYTCLPIPMGAMAITANGTVSTGNQTLPFCQNFTLNYMWNRWFVTTDSFNWLLDSGAKSAETGEY